MKKILKDIDAEVKAEEWKKYQQDTGRRVRSKVAASGAMEGGTVEHKGGEGEDSPSRFSGGGMSLEQARELDEKLRRLEEIERSLEAKEKAMQVQARLAEERSSALERAVKMLEDRSRPNMYSERIFISVIIFYFFYHFSFIFTEFINKYTRKYHFKLKHLLLLLAFFYCASRFRRASLTFIYVFRHDVDEVY